MKAEDGGMIVARILDGLGIGGGLFGRIAEMDLICIGKKGVREENCPCIHHEYLEFVEKNKDEN